MSFPRMCDACEGSGERWYISHEGPEHDTPDSCARCRGTGVIQPRKQERVPPAAANGFRARSWTRAQWEEFDRQRETQERAA